MINPLPPNYAGMSGPEHVSTVFLPVDGREFYEQLLHHFLLLHRMNGVFFEFSKEKPAERNVKWLQFLFSSEYVAALLDWEASHQEPEE